MENGTESIRAKEPSAIVQPADHTLVKETSEPPSEEAPAHLSEIMPEKHFRWRAGEITRLEAFCDIVFGFALTLLVISLEVPRNYSDLMNDLRGFFPFAFCFALLVMIWRVHYIFSRRYGLQDGYTVFLNMVLLFLVLFYVYPLKFVFTLTFDQVMGGRMGGSIGFHEGSMLIQLFSAGFASVFLLFALMFAHAYRLRRRLALNDVEVHLTRAALQTTVLLTALGISALVVAFWSPTVAGLMYNLMALQAIHGIFVARRTRKIVERGAGQQVSESAS